MLVNSSRYLWLLQNDALKYLVSAAPIVTFKKGDYLTLEGHNCNTAFLLIDGEVVSDYSVKSSIEEDVTRSQLRRLQAWDMLYNSNLLSKEFSVEDAKIRAVYKSGELIGEAQLLAGSRYGRSFKCSKDSKVMIIDRALFYEVMYTEEYCGRFLSEYWEDDPRSKCYQLAPAVFPKLSIKKQIKNKLVKLGSKVKSVFRGKPQEERQPSLRKCESTYEMRTLFDTPLWKTFKGPVIVTVKPQEENTQSRKAFFYCIFHETPIVKLCNLSDQVPWWEAIDEHVRRKAIGAF